eukprot:Opistho-2@58118
MPLHTYIYLSRWTDWNIALDIKGGPNHARNFVDAPIICDVAEDDSGNLQPQNNATRFFRQPMFYALAHFSAFIPPGSVRVAINLAGTSIGAPEIGAFRRPDGAFAVVALNSSPLFKKVYSIAHPGTGQFANLEMPAASMQTILFK